MDFKNKTLTWNNEKLVRNFVKQTKTEMTSLDTRLLSIGDECKVLAENKIYEWNGGWSLKNSSGIETTLVYDPEVINLPLPYAADTPIEISVYDSTLNLLHLHLNGIRITKFKLVDPTHISIDENIEASGETTSCELIIDKFLRKI